ncbi:MAG: hypothetical protein IID44_20695 [Planctomycetes bacterium]|nr:hypothetical protein [Planctomycetota bacterium]
MPLLVLPVAVAVIAVNWPPWIFMWALAAWIYAGLKWLTFASCPFASVSSIRRSLAYLLLWPGMDAKSFFATSRSIDRPGLWEWLLAVANTVFGVFLIAITVHFDDEHSLAAAWVGMAGIIFTLHFGLFHLLGPSSSW